MTDSPPDYNEEIERLTALISAARGHVGAGRAVDLGAMGQRMEALCRRIEAEPPVDRSGVRTRLQDLERQLDDLEKEFIARQDAHTEPTHEAAHRRAVQNYRKQDGEG